MAVDVLLEASGNMWQVAVAPGDAVQAGDTLFIMEVMKMEVPHAAPVGGTVTAVMVEAGAEGLDAGTPAVTIEPA